MSFAGFLTRRGGSKAKDEFAGRDRQTSQSVKIGGQIKSNCLIATDKPNLGRLGRTLQRLGDMTIDRIGFAAAAVDLVALTLRQKPVEIDHAPDHRLTEPDDLAGIGPVIEIIDQVPQRIDRMVTIRAGWRGGRARDRGCARRAGRDGRGDGAI